MALPTLTLGAVIAILYFGRIFFITAVVAVIIAFILEPFVALLIRLRLPRALASFVVCAIALLCLYVMGMTAYTQLAAIYAELPKYGERIGQLSGQRPAKDRRHRGPDVSHGGAGPRNARRIYKPKPRCRSSRPPRPQSANRLRPRNSPRPS